MAKKITLKKALEIWSQKIISEKTMGEHIAPWDLYEFFIQTPFDENNESVLNHLSRCPLCIKELKEIMDSVEEAEAWDIALPKAAASEKIQWPKKIPTEGGKYTIEIIRSITDKNKGLVTVQVEPTYSDELEGKKVVLKDGSGQILLRGTIVFSKVSQQIEDLKKIVPRFTVEPE